MPTVWQTAKQIEARGKALYLELAAAANNANVAGVFNLLAQEEQRHYELFDSFEQSMPAETWATDSIVADVNRIFAALREGVGDDTVGLEAMQSAETAYAKALNVEQASVSFYENALEQASTNVEKAIIGQVLSEERRHVKVVESLIMFVRRPKEWVENAEFYHLEEY